MNIAERIRAELDAQAGRQADGLDYRAALRAVLRRHAPIPMYGECEHGWNEELDIHDHEFLGIEAVNVPEIGETCVAAFEGYCCAGCCTDNASDQLERCADAHEHGRDVPYCPTAVDIAQALGLDTGP